MRVYEYDEHNRLVKMNQVVGAEHLLTDEMYTFTDVTTYEYGIPGGEE